MSLRLSFTISKHPDPSKPNSYLASPSVIFSFEGEPPSKDVIIVLDTSGSMGNFCGAGGETRLSKAKVTILNIINALTPHRDTISVLQFDGVANCVLTRQPFDPKDPNIAKKINELIPGIGTNIDAGIQASIPQININNLANTSIVLFSDGEVLESNLERDPAKIVANLKTALNGECVRIIPVGMGNGYNVDFMTKIGEETRFKVIRHIKDDADPNIVFTEILPYLMPRTQKEVTLAVSFDEQSQSRSLGSIECNQPSSDVFEFTLRGKELKDVNIQYKATMGEEETVFGCRQADPVTYDPEILAKYYKLQIKILYEEASADNLKIERLRSFITQLNAIKLNDVPCIDVPCLKEIYTTIEKVIRSFELRDESAKRALYANTTLYGRELVGASPSANALSPAAANPAAGVGAGGPVLNRRVNIFGRALVPPVAANAMPAASTAASPSQDDTYGAAIIGADASYARPLVVGRPVGATAASPSSPSSQPEPALSPASAKQYGVGVLPPSAAVHSPAAAKPAAVGGADSSAAASPVRLGVGIYYYPAPSPAAANPVAGGGADSSAAASTSSPAVPPAPGRAAPAASAIAGVGVPQAPTSPSSFSSGRSPASQAARPLEGEVPPQFPASPANNYWLSPAEIPGILAKYAIRRGGRLSGRSSEESIRLMRTLRAWGNREISGAVQHDINSYLSNPINKGKRLYDILIEEKINYKQRRSTQQIADDPNFVWLDADIIHLINQRYKHQRGFPLSGYSSHISLTLLRIINSKNRYEPFEKQGFIERYLQDSYNRDKRLYKILVELRNMFVPEDRKLINMDMTMTISARPN